MTRRLLAPAVLICIAIALGACGDDGPKKLDPTRGGVQFENGPDVGSLGGGGTSPGAGEGGGGGSGTGGGATPTPASEQKPIAGATDHDVVADPNLRLELTEPRDAFLPGQPIPVRLRLRNVGSQSVRLVEPETDLLRTIEFHIAERGGVAVRRPVAPKRADKDPKVITFEPGDTSEIELDLYPLVGGTEAYLGGRVIVRAVYRGSGWRVSAKHPDVWNADGKSRLVSYELQLVAETPEWLEREGYDEASAAEVVNLLLRWKLAGGGTDDPTEKVRALGRKGALALAHLVTWLDSTDAERAQVGGKALLVARNIGDPVLEVLRKLDGKPHAGQVQALAMLAADQRVRLKEKLSPDARAFRNVAGGKSGGSSLFIDVPQRGRVPGALYQLDARGVLTVLQDPRGAKKRYSAQLPMPHLIHIKKALNEARVWTWRPVRKRLLGPAEGRVTIGLQAPGQPPIRIAIPRMEAMRDNPVIARCLDVVVGTGNQLAGIDEKKTASVAPRRPK